MGFNLNKNMCTQTPMPMQNVWDYWMLKMLWITKKFIVFNRLAVGAILVVLTHPARPVAPDFVEPVQVQRVDGISPDLSDQGADFFLDLVDLEPAVGGDTAVPLSFK